VTEPRLTLSIRDLRDARPRGSDHLAAYIPDIRSALPDVADEDPIDVAAWWCLPSMTLPDAILTLCAAHPPERAAQVAVLVARCAATRADIAASSAHSNYMVESCAAEAAEWADDATDAVACATSATSDVDWAEIAEATSIYATNVAACATVAAAGDEGVAGDWTYNVRAAAERAAQMADLLAALEAAS